MQRIGQTFAEKVVFLLFAGMETRKVHFIRGQFVL